MWPLGYNTYKNQEKMIKANELRIGNYYNEFGIPKQADPSLILKLYQIQSVGKIAIDVTPVAITEEWLVKLPHDLVSEDIPSWIKYVHQLQNWYWTENKFEKELLFK